jgi:protocatechuate 3,4-dioxygenase beta subunit
MKPNLLNLFSTLSILLLATVSQSIAQTPQRYNRPRTASISGRVTIAGKPAVNAKIAIKIATEVKESSLRGNQEDYVALTDADGRYRVTGLAEGDYLARALLRGYVREKPSENHSLHESVFIKEGESRENIDFALVRGGVITGRVTDAEGRPLIARVVSLQAVAEQDGKAPAPGSSLTDLMTNSNAFKTDDRGVYRLFGLYAGRYLVSAGGNSDIALMTGEAGKYPLTWHPDAADENQAKIIEVKSGDEITGVDIKLGVAKRTFKAAGRVVDDETGKPIAGANVKCRKAKGDDEIVIFDTSRTDELGNFHISGLAPGEYQLGLKDVQSLLTGGGGSGYYSDGAKFEIHGADAAGVEIRVKHGATISGIVISEDADPSTKPDLSQTIITVIVTPSSEPSAQDEGDESLREFAESPVMSRIGSDGGFSLKGVRPGKVWIMASALGGLRDIARIERDGVDISEGIIVSAGREEISGVRIVLGKKGEKQ